MLLDFAIENFGPFKDETRLSMQAIRLGTTQWNVIETEQIKNGLLSSDIIYGANGSGKSYFVKGLIALKQIVGDTFESGFRYPWYEPFRNLKSTRSAPITLNIRFIINEVAYDYLVKYNSNSILEEHLYHYPNGRPKRVFERNVPNGEYKGGDKRIQSMTSSSSAYLTVAAKFNDEICNLIRNEILEITIIRPGQGYFNLSSFNYISDDPERKRLVIEALNQADLGISDYILMDAENGKMASSEIRLKHDFKDADNEDDELIFPPDIESTGTRNMLGIICPLVETLLKGGIIVLDGLGTDLHPLISCWMVKQFSDSNNPNGAQLIATTHDISLLDQQLLRRDQIWFASKSRESGASELYSLADFKGVKDSSDIQRGYCIGRYEAVPNISLKGVMR